MRVIKAVKSEHWLNLETCESFTPYCNEIWTINRGEIDLGSKIHVMEQEPSQFLVKKRKISNFSVFETVDFSVIWFHKERARIFEAYSLGTLSFLFIWMVSDDRWY